MSINRLILIASCIALCLVASLPGVAAQRKPKEQDGTTLAGPIQRTDATKSTITIAIFSRTDGVATDKTLPVAADAVILQDGSKTKLGNLMRGARANLTLSGDKTTVSAIKVEGGTVQGTFSSANFDRNTITVVAGRDMAHRVLHLIKETKITLEGGKEGTIRDLKTGTRLLLTTSVEDANTVMRIQWAPPKE